MHIVYVQIKLTVTEAPEKSIKRVSHRPTQTDTDNILHQIAIRKLADALILVAPAAGIMIQEYKLSERLPSFGNVPPFRYAEGHANHNLPFKRYA